MVQLLGYALQYSTAQGTVNGGASVMIRLGLHLTASGVVDRVVGTEMKKSFSSGRPASKFTPMVVKLVGQ
jgi:hypothetical protein